MGNAPILRKDAVNLSVRAIAKLTGVSPATASRIQNGADYNLSTAQKLLPVLSQCPCCGIDMDGVKIKAMIAENERMREALEKISCRRVNVGPLWWQLEARNAIATTHDTQAED